MNELTTTNNFITEISNPEQCAYCSFIPETKKQKIELFNAVNNPTARLADKINHVIEIKDIYCEMVECQNKETGELTQAPRLILINDKESYVAVSLGIFSSIKKIFSLLGTPSEWTEPIKVRVKQITKGEKKILTLMLE